MAYDSIGLGDAAVNTSENYWSDLLFYFDGKEFELQLYAMLFDMLDSKLPCASVKVQKSQISFYGRHLFAAASIPVRRKKAGRSAACL